MSGALIVMLAGLAADPNQGRSPELIPPIRLKTKGEFIDTDLGHAAPFVGDGIAESHRAHEHGANGDRP